MIDHRKWGARTSFVWLSRHQKSTTHQRAASRYPMEEQRPGFRSRCGACLTGPICVIPRHAAIRIQEAGRYRYIPICVLSEVHQVLQRPQPSFLRAIQQARGAPRLGVTGFVQIQPLPSPTLLLLACTWERCCRCSHSHLSPPTM